jgi:hypothetical protein
MPTLAIIKHLSLPGPVYYAGPHKGWLPFGIDTVVYSSFGAAQDVIDQHRMYAEPVSTPPSSGIVPNFIAHAVFNQSGDLRTVTSSANGFVFDFGSAGGVGPMMGLLIVGAVSGTLPTLDVRVQESDDGVSWTNVLSASFPQVNDSSHVEIIQYNRTKPLIRHQMVVSGTLPSFALAVMSFQSNL